MNKISLHFACVSLLCGSLYAQSAFEKDLQKLNPKDSKGSPAEVLQKHAKGSKKTAYDQDELSADVQDLIQEQTDGKVIQLLEEAEKLMADATNNLEDKDTGGQTIAIETEIIERIYEAAKQKQQQKQQGQGQPGQEQQPGNSAMMDMLERMMGKQPGEQGQESGQGGEQAGDGNTGDSDSANQDVTGANEGRTIERRVPKSSGNAGTALPRELHKALDAFNKATSEKLNR